MKTINLAKGFTPYEKGEEIETASFLFSGGEVHVKLKGIDDDVIITTRLNSSDNIMKLLLTVDALKRSGTSSINAFIPYLPYARQDRVMVEGEPLSVKVMCDLLNGCGFKKIFLFDVHSEVSLALLNNCQLIPNYNLVKTVIGDKKDYLLVSPDAGALKKIYKMAEAIQYTNDIVLCNKVRDVSNGDIKGITVDKADLSSKDCFIVDDICDGGATFVGVAKELKKRNAGKVNLIVSHGIFSKGEAALTEYIDHIYTTDSIKDSSSSFITCIPLHAIINL